MAKPRRPSWFPELPKEQESLLAAEISPILGDGLRNLKVSSQVLEKIVPTLRKMCQEFAEEMQHVERDVNTKRMTPEARKRLGKELIGLTVIFERVCKAMSYHSQITDQMARLSITALGGPDSRKEINVNVDVDGMGELELVEMMLEAAAASGKLCPACTRRALGGPVNGNATAAIEGPQGDG